MPDNPIKRSTDEAAPVLQAILDTTVDGLITINDCGRILSFNKACETIFGYAEAEVMGENVSFLMPAPYRKEHDDYLDRYHQGGEASIIGKGREVRGLRKDGSSFPLDLAVAKVEVKGRVLYSGIVRDITERKQAEAKILLQNEELARFAFMASHDLKEPLRSIEAFAEILLLDYADKLDDAGREYLNILMSASSRLRHIVNSVLEYSRLDADASSVIEFEVGDVLTQLCGELSNDLEKKNAWISHSDLPALRGDRIRFYRLIQNLISNALKYCPPERDPDIRVSAALHNGYWQFRVQDNGIGIQPEYRSVVFGMFKRLHARDAYPGTGIGLAICRRIVESWGGKIWIEAAPDYGSVFCFTFPVMTGMTSDNGI